LKSAAAYVMIPPEQNGWPRPRPFAGRADEESPGFTGQDAG